MRTPIDRQATGEEQSAIDQAAPRYRAGVLLSGKYRLEALLGEGGMGSVWQATNTLLDLLVAIKLIRADLDHGALRARLRLEARSAAKLGHPAIVRVYDVGESELGDPFIVMEHLRGETLGQLLSAGPLPAIRAVQLLLPIIDALAVAHGRGIVHRDLKPDNLMIALEEQQVRPKILDFGIAKLTDSGHSQHKLTDIGAVVGSPEYMSPEQARGQDDVDAGTDIWSMCVVLYETLTGSPPFTASNYNALLRSIVEDVPKPLSGHAPGTSELWAILERGLHKDRARRYTKISELGQALAAWLAARGVTEDACGSSLDCKWFGRANAPLSSGQAVAFRSPSQPSRARLDSDSGSSEPSRGPFSATIRAVAGGSKRTLDARLAAYALLFVPLLVLGQSPHTAGPAAAGPALGVALAATATASVQSAIPSARPESRLTSLTSLNAKMSSANTKLETVPVSSIYREPVAKPHAATPPLPKRAPIVVRANTRIATPTAASAPSAESWGDRPLDLLAPY
jgi:serine/threonine-protein kinase